MDAAEGRGRVKILGILKDYVMAKRESRPPEPEMLVATIESVERTYYISETRGEVRRVEDEAILDIVGRIERLDRSCRQYLGQRIEISLLCARSFGGESPSPPLGKPFLTSVQLADPQIVDKCRS